MFWDDGPDAARAGRRPVLPHDACAGRPIAALAATTTRPPAVPPLIPRSAGKRPPFRTCRSCSPGPSHTVNNMLHQVVLQDFKSELQHRVGRPGQVRRRMSAMSFIRPIKKADWRWMCSIYLFAVLVLVDAPPIDRFPASSGSSLQHMTLVHVARVLVFANAPLSPKSGFAASSSASYLRLLRPRRLRPSCPTCLLVAWLC